MRNETGTEQFQNCFKTVLFQFLFVAQTVLALVFSRFVIKFPTAEMKQ